MLRAMHACALAMLSVLARSALAVCWRSVLWGICGSSEGRRLSWKLRVLVCCVIGLRKSDSHALTGGKSMPPYHRLGQIPPKRHTQFRKPDGTLYFEELFGIEGFSNNYSNLYYTYPPTRVKKVEPCSKRHLEEWHVDVQRHHHLKTARLQPGGDAVSGNQTLMFNRDLTIGIALPTEEMDNFYRAGDADL